MTLLRKQTIFIFLILNIGILSIALIYNFLFEAELIGSCAFLEVLGFYCPGCGGSRSLNALLSFDFIKSFIYFPAIPIASLFILELDVRLFIGYIKNKNLILKMKKWRIYVTVGTVILNFLIKNILLLFRIDLLGNVI